MWLDKQVSFYECAADNTGRVATLRDILLCRVAVPHRYYYKSYPADIKTYPKGKWISGRANDIDTIIILRKGVSKEEKTVLKQTMQCFTPAGLLKTKKKGAIEEINRTGILQLDFDYADIHEYDVEELMRCVFSLDFIALCALSCGGKGFYAFALIAEPYKLEQYAEHCFNVLLKKYGIKADTSKGRNVQDLRFVSWDGNMLIRPNPKPLQIKRFYSIKPSTAPAGSSKPTIITSSAIVNSELKKLSEAQVGSRWATVQKVAFTLGGLGDSNLLDNIKSVIQNNAAFTNEELKYSQCAEDCFRAGTDKPIIIN